MNLWPFHTIYINILRQIWMNLIDYLIFILEDLHYTNSHHRVFMFSCFDQFQLIRPFFEYLLYLMFSYLLAFIHGNIKHDIVSVIHRLLLYCIWLFTQVNVSSPRNEESWDHTADQKCITGSTQKQPVHNTCITWFLFFDQIKILLAKHALHKRRKTHCVYLVFVSLAVHEQTGRWYSG